MVRLLIADDHMIVREGLKQLFGDTDDIVVAGEASSGGEVIRILHEKEFDLLLLDVSMPGLSGEALVRRVHDRYPDLPILVLSMHNEPQIARRKLKAGAAGYLTKDSDPDVLLHAVRKVASGGRFLNPDMAERIAFTSLGDADTDPHHLLSSREMQILRLLANGLSINDIGEKLAISSKTVSTHKARLMKKMELGSTADLIHYAIEKGLSV
ncbi:response regulator [Nitrincola sp. MINF-07-Sa-05]|uniref:response regulator n=1 Tax=Nitrincola salilacus TaxID=3400273 RepID=UPI003917CF52